MSCDPLQVRPRLPQCESFRDGARCIFSPGHVGTHLAHSGVEWGAPAPVDLYEAHAIRRLDNAGRPCPPSASLAEAFDRARQRLADTRAALAAAERNVMTDRLEIAELEAALAEHGRKAGGA